MLTVLVALVVGVVVGAVASYLFLRANKNKAAVVAKFVDEQSAKLKK